MLSPYKGHCFYSQCLLYCTNLQRRTPLYRTVLLSPRCPLLSQLCDRCLTLYCRACLVTPVTSMIWPFTPVTLPSWRVWGMIVYVECGTSTKVKWGQSSLWGQLGWALNGINRIRPRLVVWVSELRNRYTHLVGLRVSLASYNLSLRVLLDWSAGGDCLVHVNTACNVAD